MRRHCPWVVALAILCTAIALLAAAPPVQAGLISRSEELRMGSDAARELESRYHTSDDPRVEAIGRRIARVSDRRDITYTFKVIDRDDVNALSLPGGHVYVYRGLLRMIGDDNDALAGIIAHEVGHVAERHSIEQVEYSMGANLLLELLTRGKSRTAGSIVTNLLSLHFSRKDESEADEDAVVYMDRAGYNPMGLARFFHKLEGSEGHGTPAIGWLQTHPSSAARARRVEELADDLRSHRRRR